MQLWAESEEDLAAVCLQLFCNIISSYVLSSYEPS